MRTYREYAPTPFDPKGLNLPDQQDWLVLIGQSRDSSTLDRSNFECALDRLGGESDTVQVCRFEHWACGWFEIIIINPKSEQAQIAKDIEEALKQYPVVNEGHWSELEFNEAVEYWVSISISERMEWCRRFSVSIFAARRNEIPEDESGELISYLAE